MKGNDITVFKQLVKNRLSPNGYGLVLKHVLICFHIQLAFPPPNALSDSDKITKVTARFTGSAKKESKLCAKAKHFYAKTLRSKAPFMPGTARFI